MKAYELKVSTIILRFYLMMLIVIGAGFIGQWWLAALALPILISIMLGITFGKGKEAKIRTIEPKEKEAQKVG